MFGSRCHSLQRARRGAKAFLAVQKEFGSFDQYIWTFVGHEQRHNARKSMKEVPAKTPDSDAVSKDLKRRAFKFVGAPFATPSCNPWAWSTIILSSFSGTMS